MNSIKQEICSDMIILDCCHHQYHYQHHRDNHKRWLANEWSHQVSRTTPWRISTPLTTEMRWGSDLDPGEDHHDGDLDKSMVSIMVKAMIMMTIPTSMIEK